MDPVNKILLGISAAIAFVITVIFIYLSLANAHLKTQLAEALANGTACHMANDDFAAKQAQQNKVIEQIKSDGAAREKRAEAAADAAQKEARIYFASADKLRNVKERGDACKAADKLFGDYIGGGK